MGQAYPLRPKILVGLVGFFSLSFIIFMPLLLYSSFSPALESNAIEQLGCTIAFSAEPPLYTSSTRRNLPLLAPESAHTLARRIQVTRGALPPEFSDSDNFLQV